MTAIKTGIIGYGNMGGWHTQAISGCKGFDLVAVHDIRPERNRRAEEAHGLVGYDSLSDFLAHPGLELVVVATPNHVHKQLACAAMDAGKHVVCEKPVAPSLAELEGMIASGQRNKVLFTVHHNRRRDSDYLTVKHAIAGGALGHIIDVQSRVSGWSKGEAGWRGVAEFGGGMLLDWGVHLLDQMVDLAGMPESIYARVESICLQVDDFFKVQLRWSNGFSAEVEMCPRTAFPTQRWVVKGTQGSLVFADWGDASMKIEDATGALKDHPVEMVHARWEDYYAVGMWGAIREGKELWVKPESVRPVMRIIEACRKSQTSGEVVHLAQS